VVDKPHFDDTFLAGVLPKMWTGARLRCPVCGQGRIFRSWLRMNGQCERCGTPFLPEPGDFGGAMVLFLVSAFFTLLVGLLVFELVAHPPHEAHALIVLAFAFLVPMLAYRPVKGAWVGVIHAMRHLK
jgi:uncharacterized protein (DUF983 family)